MAVGVRARKRFGQHFLADRGLAARIAVLAAPGPGQALLEIGPGTGALTAPLIELYGHLAAVEVDRDLVARLRARFRQEQLRLLEADILQVDLHALAAELGGGQLTVVGNLPYNITAPVLFHLLAQRACVDRAVLMVQREVADRLAAAPGSKQYGQITVVLGLWAELRRLVEVPPRAFRPVPRVHSAVIECRFCPGPRHAVQDPQMFVRVVRTAFGQRRKMLRNSLRGVLVDAPAEHLATIAEATGTDLEARPEQLSVAEFARLSDAFSGVAAALGRPTRVAGDP